MEFSNKVKKQILKGFIEIFTRIASKEYQKRIWINGEGPEVDAFDDTVNDYFIECDSILENYKEFGITDSQYQILKKFRDQFRKFSDEHYWPSEFIDTPEWEEITEMAKGILKAFNFIGDEQMISMKVNKRKISVWFLPNLYCISDKKYQKRIWIEGAGPECQDFDEAVNDFFAEGDHILENYQDYGLSRIQYQLLKQFRDEFDLFVKSNHFPEEFIDSPEWAKIMDSAKEVLQAFNYQSENIKQILQSLFEAIEGISDKKYQERVWVLGEETECDDFSETIRRFFEEGKGILEKYKDFGITDKQYELLVKLRDQLDKFVKDPRLGHLPQGFTDTPDWEKITETANEVLKAFNYKKLRK